MSRQARVVIPGCAHRVTQRGNNRQDVLFVDADRRHYLALLADSGRMPWPVKLGALVRWPKAVVEQWIANGASRRKRRLRCPAGGAGGAGAAGPACQTPRPAEKGNRP